jgi:PAS domain S-box-containing protein
MDSARILIVEDDAILAAHLEDLLHQLGYQVTGMVATGAEAVQTTVARAPDAILMDINLRGGMTGIQAADEIHNSADIPVVYLTAYTDDTLLQQAKTTDAFAYLAKPVRDRELRASLEMALYKHAAEQRLRHLNQVLRAVRDVNQLITHEHDPTALLDKACGILVRARGYRLAWIDQQDGRRFKSPAQADVSDGFLDRAASLAAGGQDAPWVSAGDPIGRSPAVCHDLPGDERFARWRAEAESARCYCSACVPLLHAGRLFGRLGVFSDRTGAFSGEEIDLLLELAGDLAFGLQTMEKEVKRVDAERALQESERRYRLISDNSGDVIWTLDLATGRFTYVSPSVQRLRGMTPEEVLAEPMQASVSAESYQAIANDLPERLARFAAGDATARVRTDEVMQIHKDGSLIPTEVVTTFITDPAGNVVEALGVTRDISERKQAEETIRRLNVELEKRVVERTAQLEEVNRELEAFTYSVSHDLRAPLRIIDGFSSILLEQYAGGLDDEGRRLLKIIRNNTSRMDQLIIDLLAFSRVTRSEMKRSRLDMSALAKTAYADLTFADGRENCAFTIAPLPDADGDPALLRQVWSNLLSNAIKYTLPKEKRVIEVGGYMESSHNVYFVRDNGVGFDPAYAHKLFGVFQRLHKPEEFEGTGVGLAIVQRIIHRHGGQAWAMGQPNQGATFFFSLPRPQAHPIPTAVRTNATT